MTKELQIDETGGRVKRKILWSKEHAGFGFGPTQYHINKQGGIMFNNKRLKAIDSAILSLGWKGLCI